MRPVAFIVLSTLCTFAATAVQAEVRHHEAHVHGHGELNLAVDDQTLYLSLKVPAHDIVGFESLKTDKQRATLEAALKQLEAPELWTLPKAAGCKMTRANATAGQDEHKEHNHHDDHNHDHDEHPNESNHMDISATYTYQCSNPKAINQLGTTLFNQFERSESIKVQALTNSGQHAATISRQQSMVSF